MKKLVLLLLKFYKKFISPCLPDACRFYPTCSEYAFTSVERFGVFKGSFLTFKRLIRCQPFCKGGIDFVPEEYSFLDNIKSIFWRKNKK